MKRILSAMAAAAALMALTGCGHQHELSEATCTAPAQCIKCGETVGEALPHSFSEATCTEAKTCSVCGFAEGEAAGHSVGFGKCSVCGVFVNEQVMIDIVDISMEADRSAEVAADYISQANKYNDRDLMYKNYCSAVNYYEKYQSKLREAYQLCAQHSELGELRVKINKVISYDLASPRNNSVDELVSFIDRLVEFNTLQQEYAYEMLDIVESIPD